jgi:ornithine cyclodeaminase
MDAMEEVLSTLARGEALLPLRSILWLPEKVGGFGLMPAALLPQKVVGVKAITFFPGNEGTELDTHQGAVLLFEAERGRLLAVMDATSIAAIRTAAASGVATRRLARKDAGDLAIVGSGTQARTHSRDGGRDTLAACGSRARSSAAREAFAGANRESTGSRSSRSRRRRRRSRGGIDDDSALARAGRPAEWLTPGAAITRGRVERAVRARV